MSTQAYLVNQQSGKRFKVLDFDPEKGTIKLQGEIATWTEKFDKELFKRLGYKMVQEQVNAE